MTGTPSRPAGESRTGKTNRNALQHTPAGGAEEILHVGRDRAIDLQSLGSLRMGEPHARGVQRLPRELEAHGELRREADVAVAHERLVAVGVELVADDREAGRRE